MALHFFCYGFRRMCGIRIKIYKYSLKLRIPKKYRMGIIFWIYILSVYTESINVSLYIKYLTVYPADFTEYFHLRKWISLKKYCFFRFSNTKYLLGMINYTDNYQICQPVMFWQILYRQVSIIIYTWAGFVSVCDSWRVNCSKHYTYFTLLAFYKGSFLWSDTVLGKRRRKGPFCYCVLCYTEK